MIDGIASAIAAVATDVKPFIDERFAQAHERDAQIWREEFTSILAIENDGDRADRLLPFLVRLIAANGEVTGGIGTHTERLIPIRSSQFAALVSIAIRFRKLTLDMNSLQFRRSS